MVAMNDVSIDPWTLDDQGLLRLQGPHAQIEFNPLGMHVVNATSSTWIPWKEVVALAVSIPNHRKWVRTAVVAIGWVGGTSPVLRANDVHLNWRGHAFVEQDFDLGRPPQAPYSTRSAMCTELIFLTLNDAKALDALGDPERAGKVMHG